MPPPAPRLPDTLVSTHPAVATTHIRLLVAVTAHYNPAKLPLLAEVLRSLAELAVARLAVVLVTNTAHPDHLATIRRVATWFLPPAAVDIRSYPNLPDPRDLPWCHKADVLQARFLNGAEDFTHFLYLEDDERFSQRNLAYFLRYRDALRPHGLLPSFLRVEFHPDKLHMMSVDYLDPTAIAHLGQVDLGTIRFVTPAYPYCGLYLLDRELAAEHIASPAFGPETSEGQAPWGRLERAAMGLCFESPPPGFTTRYVLPLLPDRVTPLADCWVHHLGDKYVTLPDQPLSRLDVGQIFY